MKKAIWFAAGLGAGAYAAWRGQRAAEALTADGLRDRAKAVGLGLRLLRDEIAQGKADAEVVLRRQFGLDDEEMDDQ